MRSTQKKPERTVGKWWAEIGYNVTGWRPFLHALREHYKTDDKLPALVNDPAIPRVSLEHCFVNLALIEQIDHEKQEKIGLSGAVAAEAALERGDLYQSLLSAGRFRGVDGLMGTLHDRDTPTGWACITGRAGTGKTTLLQYIAYRWGMRDTLWHNRFDFTFRLKLNLMGQKDFWDKLPEHLESDVGYLSWLIYKSLGASSTFSLADIHAGLTKETLKITTLLLLDGFDEIQSLYGEGRDARVTALIDKAMQFPNGILTSRPNAIPEPWITAGRFTQRFENIGLTEDNVRHYVQHYFEALLQPEIAESLLIELSVNPEMMSLAQIPVNIAALCLTWDKEAKSQAAQETKKILTMTMLYQRVIVWLVRRYDAQCKLSAEESLKKISAMQTPAAQLLVRHARPLEALAALAFDAFESGEIQSLSHATLLKHFPDYTLLHDLSTQWGLLRAFPLSDQEGEYPRHYFIHLTYQEYFVALYMAQKLSEPPSDNRGIEINRRQTIQSMARLIQAKKAEPRYAVIWTFLTGILSTPEYSRGADYFWDACIDSFEPLLSPVIGLHPHVKILESQWRIYREALMTHVASSTFQPYTLPKRLAMLQNSIQSFFLWQTACQIKDLNPLWDKEDDSIESKSTIPKASQMTRRMDNQRQQQNHHTQETLDWPRLSPLPLQLFLAQNPVWGSSLQVIRDQLLQGNNKIPNQDVGCFRKLHHDGYTWGDKDTCVRVFAAQTLSYIGATDVESLIALRTALQDRMWYVCAAAAEALGHIGVTDVETLRALRTVLRTVLKDRDSHYDDSNNIARSAAAEALGNIGATDAETLSALCTAIQSRNFHERYISWTAAEALFKIDSNDAESLDFFRRCLEVALKGNGSAMSSDIHRAARIFGNIGAATDAKLLKVFYAHMHDSEWGIRAYAAEALGHLKTTDAKSLNVLRNALKDSYHGVRSRVAKALGNIGAADVETVSALRTALNDIYSEVRVAAVEALENIGATDAETRSALRTALKDEDVTVQGYAKVRFAAAKALGNMGATDVETLLALRTAFKESHDGNRLSFAAALGNIGGTDAKLFAESCATLCAGLKEWGGCTRRFAAEALKRNASHIQDRVTLLLLLEEAGKLDARLEILRPISIALLRVSSATYAALPELLTDATAQRFFMMSVWLQGCNVMVDIEKNQMTVDGKIFRLLGTSEIIRIFVQQLQVYQAHFIETVVAASPERSPILHTLTQPIVLPRITSVFEEHFLTDNLPAIPEDRESSAINALFKRLALIQESITQINQRLHSGEVLTQEQQGELTRLGDDLRGARSQIVHLQQQAGSSVSEMDFDPVAEQVTQLQSRLSQLELASERSKFVAVAPVTDEPRVAHLIGREIFASASSPSSSERLGSAPLKRELNESSRWNYP